MVNKQSHCIYKVSELVPHSATMSLLDEIVDSGEDWLKAKVVVSKDSLFVTEFGVPSWIGIEYMAQTVAAYDGMRRKQEGLDTVIGFLIGIRKYHCNTPQFAIGSELIVTANLDFQSDNGLGSFQCRIDSEPQEGNTIRNNSLPIVEASASVNVFQPENVDEFLKNES